MQNILKGFSNIFQRRYSSESNIKDQKEFAMQKENNLFSLRMKNQRPNLLINVKEQFTQKFKCRHCISELLSNKYRHISESESKDDLNSKDNEMNFEYRINNDNDNDNNEVKIDNSIHQDNKERDSNYSFSFGVEVDQSRIEEPSFAWSKAINVSETEMKTYYDKLSKYICNKGDYRNFPQIDYFNYSKVMQ